MLTETEKEAIRNQAKAILESFAKRLDDVDTSSVRESESGEGGVREEGEGESVKEIFRKAMFDNAPKSSGDFIVAESKKW